MTSATTSFLYDTGFYSDQESYGPTAYKDIRGQIESLATQPSNINHKASREEEPESSYFNELTKTFATTMGICILDAKFSPKIAEIATKLLGFCLGNYLPKNGPYYLSYIINPLARLNNSIGNLFGSNITAKIFIPALLEEVEFRGFLQDILLRKLPKKIAEQISPNLSKLVDSVPVRISRVAATALFFAYCHTHALGCGEGGGIPQLIGGLLYGTLYEISDNSLMHCINLHCIYNLLSELGVF